MFESLVIGIVQGITEWLPISSEGAVVLLKANFFGGGHGIGALIEGALFLHLGTFFAALIYFRRGVAKLVGGLVRYRDADSATQKTLVFLIVATLVSGALGFVLLQVVVRFEPALALTSRAITVAISVLLLVTAMLQLGAWGGGKRKAGGITTLDTVLLGIAQGFAVLPGLSRSGLTVSALLLRNFTKRESLTLSFLLSLPIVLAGNVVLKLGRFALSTENLVGALAAFAFGFLTIKFLMRLAERVNFGYFVLGFGLLTIAAVFV